MALALLHPTGAPAGVTTGGSSHAGTIHHVHTRSTCFADGNDRLIRLLKVRERHGDCRCRQGQSKRNRYQLRHCFPPGWPLGSSKHCVCFGGLDLGQCVACIPPCIMRVSPVHPCACHGGTEQARVRHTYRAQRGEAAGAIGEAELALIQKATAPASGLQSYRHPGQTERRFKTKLYSMQFKDHTLLVLQLGHFGAADDSEAGRSCPIGSSDISRSPQIASGPLQIDCGNANRAEADATDAQPITLAVEGQGAASATDSDNESCFDDLNADGTGLRPGFRRPLP